MQARPGGQHPPQLRHLGNRVGGRLLVRGHQDPDLRQPHKPGDCQQRHTPGAGRCPQRQPPQAARSRQAQRRIQPGKHHGLRIPAPHRKQRHPQDHQPGDQHRHSTAPQKPRPDSPPLGVRSRLGQPIDGQPQQQGNARIERHEIPRTRSRRQPHRRERRDNRHPQETHGRPRRPHSLSKPGAIPHQRECRPRQQAGPQFEGIGHEMLGERPPRGVEKAMPDIGEIDVATSACSDRALKGHLPTRHQADKQRQSRQVPPAEQHPPATPPQQEQPHTGHKVNRSLGALGQCSQCGPQVAQAPCLPAGPPRAESGVPSQQRDRNKQGEQRIGLAEASQFDHLPQAGENQSRSKGPQR